MDTNMTFRKSPCAIFNQSTSCMGHSQHWSICSEHLPD